MMPVWMLAVGASAAASPVVPVVACAAPIHFAAPYPWHYAADLPTITAGTVLRIDVDDAEGADLLRPRDVGQRVLYAEGWPVEVLAWGTPDAAGGVHRAVVLAPVPLPAGPIHVGFGGETLPERVDAAVRKREAEAAVPGQAVAADAGWTVAAGTPRATWVGELGRWAEGCQ